MSCCAPGLEVALEIGLARPFYDREIVLASRDIGKRLGCRDRVTPQLKRDAEVATWNSAGGARRTASRSWPGCGQAHPKR